MALVCQLRDGYGFIKMLVHQVTDCYEIGAKL